MLNFKSLKIPLWALHSVLVSFFFFFYQFLPVQIHQSLCSNHIGFCCNSLQESANKFFMKKNMLLWISGKKKFGYTTALQVWNLKESTVCSKEHRICSRYSSTKNHSRKRKTCAIAYNYLLFYKVKKIVNCYNSQYTYSDEELQNNSLKSYLPKSRIFLIVQNTSVNVYSAPFILQ